MSLLFPGCIEIDCPKRAAPDPHTIVLWHLIHELTVHTASQQAHGKLKVDSVRFYHTLSSTGYDPRFTQSAKGETEMLVGGTTQDVQTSMKRRSPVEIAVRVRVQITNIWKRDNKNLDCMKMKNGVHQHHDAHQRHPEVRWNA